jgi:hypothetical protein
MIYSANPVELGWQYGLIDDALDLRLRMGEEELEDYHAAHALPSETDTNKILQYETAAQKRFDWAQQKVLESQRRRRKARRR